MESFLRAKSWFDQNIQVDAIMADRNVLPDLQHKMSKKIAQLTKVIYQLNSKNDDHEFELQSVTDAYEQEIDEVA